MARQVVSSLSCCSSRLLSPAAVPSLDEDGSLVPTGQPTPQFPSSVALSWLMGQWQLWVQGDGPKVGKASSCTCVIGLPG